MYDMLELLGKLLNNNPHDQPRDQCMISHVISACTVT